MRIYKKEAQLTQMEKKLFFSAQKCFWNSNMFFKTYCYIMRLNFNDHDDG